MKRQVWTGATAFVVGAISGPFALSSARSSQPGLDWNTIAFVFIGTLIGTIFVIGLQILRTESKHGHHALRFFLAVSLFVLGSGIGALAFAVYGGQIDPASIFFGAAGIGLVIGVLLSRVAHGLRFK